MAFATGKGIRTCCICAITFCRKVGYDFTCDGWATIGSSSRFEGAKVFCEAKEIWAGYQINPESENTHFS